MKDEGWGEWEPIDNKSWGDWQPVKADTQPAPEQYPDQVSRSHAEASAPVVAPAPDEMDTMGVGTKQPPKSVGESLTQTGKDLATGYGPAEAAVNAATGFLFGFPGYIGGAIGGLADATGRVIAGEDASTIPQTMKERAEAVSQAFTYQPQTEAGKRLSEGLMYPLKAIAESGGTEGIGGAVAQGASKLGLPDTPAAWAGAAADASWQMAATVLGAKALGMAMPERAGPKPNVTPTPADERAFGEKLRATILDTEAPQEQRAAAASAVASRIHDVDPAAAEVFLSNTLDAIKNKRPVDLSANAANKMKDTSVGGDIEGQFTRESDVPQLTGPESGRTAPAPEGELTGEVDPLTLEPIRRPVENAPAPRAEEPVIPAEPEAPRALPSPNQVAIPMDENRGPFEQGPDLAQAAADKVYAARDAVEAARQPAAHEIAIDPNDVAGSIKAIAEAPITPVARNLEAPRNVDMTTHANAAGDLAGIMLSIDHLSRQEKVTPPAQRPAIREQIARLQVEARQAIANHGAQFGPEAGQSMHRVAAETFHNMKGDYRSLVRPPAVPQIESVKSDNASNIGQNNAVQEPSTGAVLQRQPSEAGVAGSERGRVEQGVQGGETAQAREAVPAQGNRELGNAVPALADHVGALTDNRPLPAQTESQKILPATRANVVAGNAALDHRKLGPFNISVENRAGTTRTDMHNIPPKWQSEMKADYGYAKGTTGNDGDHLDFFIKKGTPEDYNGKMYVVDQVNAKGGFDEHKVMAGYGSLEEAKAAYLSHYPKDWKGLKDISEVSTAGLRHWSRFGDMKKPYAEKKLTDEEHKVNFNKGSFQDRVDQLMKDHGMAHEDALAEAKTEMAQRAPVNAEFTQPPKTGNLLTRQARENPRAGVSEIRGLQHLVLNEPMGQFLGNNHADGLNARKLTVKEHSVVAGLIKDVLGAGVPQHYFDGLTPFVVYKGMPGSSAIHMLSGRDAAIGLSEDVLNMIARGDERASRALPMILIHELGHHMDTQKTALGWKSASEGAILAHEKGAVMKEAVDYWKNGADRDLQQFLSYPLANEMSAREYQEEVFAQMTALWYTHNDLLRNELPHAYALMEKVHEAVAANPEGISNARIAVHGAVRAFTPGEPNVRAGSGSNRPAESDKRSAAHRDTTPGVGDVARGSAENDRLGSVEGKPVAGGLKVKTPAVSPAIKYREGESPLKGNVGLTRIGEHFDELAKKDGGPFDMSNPEHVARAGKLAEQEFRFQLKQARNGLDWYADDIKTAHELTSKYVPELTHGSGDDSVLGAASAEVHRQAFSLVAAIHSPGQDASTNWENAGRAYKVFTETGKLPEINPETDARWGPHVNPLPSAQWNSMVEDMGLEKTVEWLLSEHKVSELNAMKAKYGIYKNAPVSGKRDEVKLGAHIFGPKVGPFALGLNGFNTEVAVDSWATRTTGRWFGNVIQRTGDKAGQVNDSPTPEQRRVFTQIAVDIGKKTGYTPNQVQAVLWFFEQQLYSHMGLDSPSRYFSDGAKKLLRRVGLDDTGTATATGDERRTRAGPPTEAGQAGEATVNIGLDTNDRIGISADHAVKSVEDTGAKVARRSVVNSKTEPTLVATLDRPLTPEEAHGVAVATRQEAIAQRVGGKGELYGPQADNWKPFDNKLFLDHPEVKADAERPPLTGLPKSSPGPFEPARAIAATYMEEAGLPYHPPQDFVRVDIANASRIAQAYDDMPHAPNDPAVKASYRAMIDETRAQWKAIQKTGLKVTFADEAHPYPYKVPSELFADMRDNNHMWVFPTEGGFGHDGSGNFGDLAPSTKPGEPEHVARVSDVNKFMEAAKVARGASKFGPVMGDVSAAKLKGARLFMSEDGKSGFAIGPDGDLLNTFSSANKRFPILMEAARLNGVTKVDTLDTGMVQKYEGQGFTEVGREPWSDQYAPAGWDKSLGKPDHVYLTYKKPVGTRDMTHPLLEPAGKVNGKPVVANDIFRIVHDYFGHAKEGIGFRHDGEENAWRQHAAMYSPLARKAMTSETRGQNSWVNFGPRGEFNRTASQEATIYADQKAGLLPDEFVKDSEKKTSAYAGQIDTPAFKKWFGDSKVVDENGEPKVVYHGTSKDTDFSSFNIGGRGAWFTENPGTASEYAQTNDSQNVVYDGGKYVNKHTASRVMPVYLSIKNPFNYAHLPEAQKQKLMTATNYAKAQKEVFSVLANKGYDGIDHGGGIWIAFHPEQIKSAIGNNGNFDVNEKKISMSRHDFGTLTPEQEAALKNTGGLVDKATLKQRYQNLTNDIGMKVKQGMVDQFAPLQNLDPKAYMLARLSKASDGALEAMMTYGNLSMLDGVTDAKAGGLGVIDSLQKLQGEHHRFMWWVAAHRAEQLTKEQRENLFSQQDITALKTLNLGNMPDGSSRQAAYMTALKEYNQFSRNILDIAEKSGIIDGASRAMWEKEFYVPFYRAVEDGKSTPNISRSSGLVRQYAFKKLKGGGEKLHQDLLANVLMNWSHLLSASAKNRAAEAALKAAEQAGIATQVPNDTKGSVWYLDKGNKVSYDVDDPFVMDAITALESGVVGGWAGAALSKVKNLLTMGVTANPTFKIRNLMRDSIASIAQSGLSVNIAGNVLGGVNEMRKKGQNYASMLAGGGLIRFGSMLEGNRSHHVDKLVRAGVEARTILDTRDKMLGMVQVAWDHYNELGDISEGANRISLYKQLRAKGMSHAEATLQARDLLDFSMGGSWSAVRFLTQSVPFMNARIQGLYKLGKEARNRPGRMAAVIGGVALASVLLMSYYADDPDWKKREDWDRDNYWWFKIGGTAYRIPKPFEVGAMATLAERGVERFSDSEMTTKRLLERIQYALSQTFSLNPVPQLAKPILDVYANTNSFTGNPIEGKSSENLKKEDRSTASTSEFAKAFSPITTSIASAVGAPGISPVQLDYLVKGYFGWLGTMALAASDAAVKPFVDRPTQASAQLKDMPVVGNFAESLPADSSRYVSQFYKQAKEIEEAYASYQAKKASGDKQAAAESKAEDAAKIKLEPKATGFTRQLSEINAAIRKLESSRDMDPDTKRTKLSIQYARRNSIAERAAHQTEFE